MIGAPSLSISSTQSIFRSSDGKRSSSDVVKYINSILDKKCLDENDLEKLPNWKNALKRYLKEIEVIE